MLGALTLCLVVAVSDGDTIKVRCGEPDAYEQVTIRLAEIDAPEKGQPFGQRSKASLSDLCFGSQAAIRPLTAFASVFGVREKSESRLALEVTGYITPSKQLLQTRGYLVCCTWPVLPGSRL